MFEVSRKGKTKYRTLFFSDPHLNLSPLGCVGKKEVAEVWWRYTLNYSFIGPAFTEHLLSAGLDIDPCPRVVHIV